MLLAMPSSGLEPETSPLPRECSTAELQGQFKSGPGWASHDCLQHTNSEVCLVNLECMSKTVKKKPRGSVVQESKSIIFF